MTSSTAIPKRPHRGYRNQGRRPIETFDLPQLFPVPDDMNKYLDTVVICPLTSKLHLNGGLSSKLNARIKSLKLRLIKSEPSENYL